MCACCAAEMLGSDSGSHSGSTGGLEIHVFEATDKIGRPILRSGNGRCNFSNVDIRAGEYNDPQFVEEVLKHVERTFRIPASEACPNPVIGYFEDHGVIWREEAQGRVYPQANRSSVILDVFLKTIERKGIHIHTDTAIVAVDEEQDGESKRVIHTADGRILHMDYVVISAGGKESSTDPAPFVASVPKRPVLGPIKTTGSFARKLDNIRVRGTFSLIAEDGRIKAQEAGEAMFRKFGVSGIAAFNLSRKLERADVLSIDVLPSIDLDDMPSFLHARSVKLKEAYGYAPTNFDMLAGIVLPRVADVILEHAKVNADDEYKDDNSTELTRIIKAFTLVTEGIGDVSLCQVDRGGYRGGGLHPETLECIDYENLFITGEALDVDGPCGGYNLHWAFATGMLAASAIVQRITAQRQAGQAHRAGSAASESPGPSRQCS